MDKKLQISRDITMQKGYRKNQIKELVDETSVISHPNTKSQGGSWRHYPKNTKEEKNKSNLTFSEVACVTNEDYIMANAQILLCQNTKTFEDIYNNWENIIQINFYTNEDLSCPICMEPPIIPRTDICGHVYCLPCLKTFLSYKSEFHNKCALCNQSIDINRVKRAGIIHQFTLKVGDTLSMLLMKRNKSSIFPTPINSNLFSIPHVNTVESRFSHFAVCSNDYVLSIIQMEIMALEDEFKTAFEEGSDRITSISDALESVTKEFDFISLLPSIDMNNKTAPIVVTIETLKRTIVEENVYYQSEEGYNFYMCPVNWRCMSHEFMNNAICLPDRISALVIDIERFVVTPEFHDRYRYLRHLPMGSSVHFVELDLSDIVSQSTLEKFQGAIKNKSDYRLQKEKMDEIDTLNKFRHENSFHDGSKFIHVPSLMATCTREADSFSLDDFVPLTTNSVSIINKQQKSFSHMVQESSRPSLSHQMLNMSINEAINNDQQSSRGILLSDCVVKTKKNKRR